jgi:hypothetical protein
MTFSVAAALNAHLVAKNEDREADGYWHPSGLFTCDRQAIYAFRGTPMTNPPNEQSLRVFRMGHLVHGFVQEAIASHPDVQQVWLEVPVISDTLGVKGHADALVLFTDGTYEVIEVKSIKAAGMKYGDLPKVAHIKQGIAYAIVLRDGTSIFEGDTISDGFVDLDTGVSVVFVTTPDGRRVSRPGQLGAALRALRVVYVSKDDMLVSEHVLAITPEREAAVRDTLTRLRAFEAAGILPKRLPKVKGAIPNFPCNYCSYKDRCWGTDPEGV